VSRDKGHGDSKSLVDDASQETLRKDDDKASSKSDRSERYVYNNQSVSFRGILNCWLQSSVFIIVIYEMGSKTAVFNFRKQFSNIFL